MRTVTSIIRILARLSGERDFVRTLSELYVRLCLVAFQKREILSRDARTMTKREGFISQQSPSFGETRGANPAISSRSPSSPSALFPFLLKCRHKKEKEKEAENRLPLSLRAFAENMKIHTVARRKYPSFKMDGFRWI